MEEIWKPVLGYEGYYEVSNFGRVKSLDRYLYRVKKIKGKVYKEYRYLVQGKILNPGILRTGYMSVILGKGTGERKTIRVHRLVACAFIQNPKDFPFVNHKDENKLNNRVDNLEWCTQKYNVNYGTATERRIKSRSRMVLQYSKKKEFLRSFLSVNEAARFLGKEPSAIRNCLAGLSRSACGYCWEYAHK